MGLGVKKKDFWSAAESCVRPISRRSAAEILKGSVCRIKNLLFDNCLLRKAQNNKADCRIKVRETSVCVRKNCVKEVFAQGK